LTEKPNGLFGPPRDWAALQHAYEHHVGPIERLAAASNLAPQSLKGYARDRKWVRLFPNEPAPKRRRRVATAAKATADPPARPLDAPPPAAAAPPATARALCRRLLGAVALKLTKMEIDMSASKPLSPIDHERHTRGLGTLAKSLEKLNDIGRAQRSGGRSTGAKPAVAPETAASDEDKLRRELAARIKRLREQLKR
jgi:hypothetical protein